MDHIVKLRKIALADIEAEQLKLKAAKEANRKRASMVVKVFPPKPFFCNFDSRQYPIMRSGKACLHDWRLGG
jgi:hypothetical protein